MLRQVTNQAIRTLATRKSLLFLFPAGQGIPPILRPLNPYFPRLSSLKLTLLLELPLAHGD